MTYIAGTAVVGKHDQTSKLFSLPFGFLGIVAGTFYQCERFISYFYDRMAEIQNSGELDVGWLGKSCQMCIP